MDIPQKNTNMDLDKKSDDTLIPTSNKTIYIDESTSWLDYEKLFGQLVEIINVGDIIGKIEASTQYVVQIPAEFEQAFLFGEDFIMQNEKTGKMWPFLMKVAENGSNQVVTPLPIVEQTVLRGNIIQELSNSYHNILMQKQLAQLSAMVEETLLEVKRIEHGQMDDRIGLLEAGKNGIRIALSMPEGEERTLQIDSSRQNLLVAQAQIVKTFERRVSEFVPVSKTAIRRFIQELFHSGYLNNKDREVEEMQEYYNLYLQATTLLAASYAIFGNTKSAEEAFSLGEDRLKKIDFEKVKSIENIHRDITDMFFNHPVEYLTAEKKACLDDPKDFDYIAIEVSGQKLLEVFNNDGTDETDGTEAFSEGTIE